MTLVMRKAVDDAHPAVLFPFPRLLDTLPPSFLASFSLCTLDRFGTLVQCLLVCGR